MGSLIEIIEMYVLSAVKNYTRVQKTGGTSESFKSLRSHYIMTER